MLRRAAFLCVVLCCAGLVASAGEAPIDAADPAPTDPAPTDPTPPEGTPTDGTPGEGAPAEAPVMESVRRYQYIEKLEITSGDSTLRIAANALVIVSTGPNVVTVELRSATGRQSKPDDPAPDKVSVLAGGSGDASWDIAPLVAEFAFGPWEKGTLQVKGLNQTALREAASVLGQGPVSNILEPDRTANYLIALQSRGRPVGLRGRQTNGPHWVDWKLTSRGGLAVGERGWTIPIVFSLPEQDAGAPGMRLAAEAKMTYSSALPGPEEGTELVTTLTYPKSSGDLTYRRTCSLKEVPEGESEGERPKTSRLPVTADLGGKASAWARTATLATLGVQRLGGVREAGLAMWVAQLGVDSLAGTQIPRVADAGAREGVTALAKLSPDLGPLSSSAESDIGMRNLIRAEAGVSSVGMTATAGAESDSRTSGVPTISIAMHRKIGDRWRIGPGVDMLWVNTNTQEPDQTWLYAGIVARGEYDVKSSTFGFSAGLAKVRYDMHSSTRLASGDFWATAFGVEWEWWSRGKLGLGAKLQYAGGDGVTFTLIQPSVRWRLGRNKTALQLHATMLNVADAEAVGGEISADGTGGGAGILIRW